MNKLKGGKNMFRGVNHVGIGVSDMDRSLKFYGELLGFTEVMFDYTGSLPGMEKVTGKPETKARVVMLKNQNTGPVGLGMIKLVQLLPPDKPEPCTVVDTTIWGDIGVAEVCFNTCVGAARVFDKLMEKGVKAVLTPGPDYVFSPYGIVGHFAYMRDPDNGLLEFIDWEMGKSLGTEPRVEGVNHVGFGVSDMDRSLKFYRELGFTDLVFDHTGPVYSMATMFPPNPPNIRCPMIANYYGAWIEPVQLLPPYKPTAFKKSWGHLGSMEFAVGVSNIEKAYEELQKKGIKFLSPPQTVEVPSGQWKYAYVVEPDNLYVSLIEPRY
jgi:catechol 2,3-dioxygenase-like lactoylglutathione lyase family enzyme